MKRTAFSPLIPVLAILLCLMAALPFLMEYAARQAASDRLVATAGRLRLEHPRRNIHHHPHRRVSVRRV